MTSLDEDTQRHAAPGRPRRGGRAPISRAQIVEEALRFVDEHGAAALSMRKLAHRLDIEAMTLYAYVTNKDDLLNAVADRVARDLSLPEAPRDEWQLRIRNAVSAWAHMEEEHPGGFPLLYRARDGTDNERGINEEIMDALATAGFDTAGVALAYQTLISFLDGALLGWPPSTWSSDRGWQYVATHIDASAFPRMAEIAPYAAQLAWEDVFYTGLDLFLRGLEARLRA